VQRKLKIGAIGRPREMAYLLSLQEDDTTATILLQAKHGTVVFTCISTDYVVSLLSERTGGSLEGRIWERRDRSY
jgi:hypothetical protein